MSTRQQLSANFRIGCQTWPLQCLQSNCCFVIIKLPHQIVAICNRRPSQQRVRLHLHRKLPLGD